jgi:hypothetical protein
MRDVVEEIFPSGVTVGKKQRETHLRIVPRSPTLQSNRNGWGGQPVRRRASALALNGVGSWSVRANHVEQTGKPFP